MSASEKKMLTIALAKGRMLSSSLELLDTAGYTIAGLHSPGRRLIFEDEAKGLRYILVKPTDLPTYVEYGAADVGIVGKDVLLEQKRDLYELLDLKIGFCRLVVAQKKGAKPQAPLYVATKYPAITRRHFTRQGKQVEIIKLHGSIELAPLLNMAGVIVDLVSTGKTLQENNLVEVEEITPVTNRLIANQGSYQIKGTRIMELIRALRRALAQLQEQ